MIHPRCLSWVRATTSRAILPTIIFFSVLFFACSGYGQSVPGFQAPDKPKVKDDTPVAVKAAHGQIPFSRIYGHLKLDSSKSKRLGQLSQSEHKRKKGDKFLRIGVVRPLATPLDPLSDSALYTVAEGYIRVAGIVSEGAVAVRVQFKDMSLPPGARVFVYSLTNPNEYYGPYEGRGASDDGTFWTPPMHGDTAVIEYFTPASSSSAKIPFKVFSIAHIYKDTSDEQAAGECELEVTPDWQNVDNIVNQKVAVRQLQKLGYRADAVANGREALEALRWIPYDLVLMDCQMPEMDGYEATAEIRRREGTTKHTPIVAMTAHALDSDREKCIAAGMDDYISKPVSAQELGRVLQRSFAHGDDERSAVLNANQASDGSPVDLEQLYEAVGEEPSDLHQILDVYLAQIPQSLEKLGVAISSGNAREVDLIAHSCAGASANCGIVALVAPFRKLEQAGREGNLEHAQVFVDLARTEFARVSEFLETIMV